VPVLLQHVLFLCTSQSYLNRDSEGSKKGLIYLFTACSFFLDKEQELYQDEGMEKARRK